MQLRFYKINMKFCFYQDKGLAWVLQPLIRIVPYARMWLCRAIWWYIRLCAIRWQKIYEELKRLEKCSGDKSSYASDYGIVTKLKHFSDTNGICLMVVHHTRKLEPADSFHMISGTNGLPGAASGAFAMQK